MSPAWSSQRAARPRKWPAQAGDQQASPGHAEVGREYYTIGDAHYIIIYFNEWYLCVIYMVIAYRFMSLS